MKRVLVHGFGSIGQRHLRVIRDHEPDLELAVLSEHGSLARADLGDGLERVYTTMGQALGFRPDAVVVANAAVAHVPSAVAWLRAGAHVLVEKPLSISSDGVGVLADTVLACGRILQVGYNLREASGVRLMKDWCQQKRLGRVHSARVEVGQHLADWRGGADPLRSVSAQRSLGGGVLLELSHELDYLQWLLGPAIWVSAQLLTQERWNIDVEDTALLSIGFDGPDACVAALQMDFVRQDATRRCTLIAERGSLRWDALTGHVQVFRSGSHAWESLEFNPPDRDATYRAQWASFASACRRGLPPAVTLADGLSVLRLADAARTSAAEGGRRVQVEVCG